VNPQDTARRPKRGRRRTATGAIAILTAVALLLAACSSSKKTGTGTSAGDSSNTAGMAAATALVTKYSQQPTQIPASTPIGKPVPKGKTLVFVSCGTPNCSIEGGIIKQATDLLGWTLKVINTDGTPETQKAAFAQAVQQKVDAVLYSAVDRATFAQYIPALAANHTFLSACCITDPVGSNGINYAIDVPAQTGVIGQLMAAWVITQSKGNAHTVYFNLPAFSILNTQGSAYADYLKQNCSSCTSDSVDIPVTALGKDVPTRIVSYLRAHTSVKWVTVSVDALAVGLPAALKAAGLNDVQIVGEGATSTNLQYIQAGQQSASVAFPYYEVMWAMVDAAARYEAGATVPASVGATPWLLIKSNAPAPTDAFPTVKDYAQQFKTLWGITG
jgi:ABC-type sugar transport system substrate-binding protein